MTEPIYHIGCGAEYGLDAFEYRLPLTVIPAEVDVEWQAWLAPYLNRSAAEVADLVRARFREVSPEFRDLSELVMEHVPFAVLVYRGAPLIWCVRDAYNGHGILYLPPELERGVVREALRPYGLDTHELLAEYFALFGGMGQGWPWEAIEFAGHRKGGTLVIEPARTTIEAGFSYKTQAEIDDIRRRYARWLGGVDVLIGDDGWMWHIGPDGSICNHQDGVLDVNGVSIVELVGQLVATRTELHLFNGVYHGFQKPSGPQLYRGED